MNDNTPSVKRQHPPSPMILSLRLLLALLLLSAAPQAAVAAASLGEVSSSSLRTSPSSYSSSLLFTPSCSFGGSSSLSGNINNGFRSFWTNPSLSTSPSKKKSSSLIAAAAAAEAVPPTSNNNEVAQLGRISYSFLVRQKQRLVQSLQKQQPQLQLYKPKTLEQQQQQQQQQQTSNTQRRQGHYEQAADISARGGGGGAGSTASAAMALVFWENMVCGAASRSVAQTIMHPANCLKTLLQTSCSSRASATATRMTAATLLQQPAASLQRLTQGAGASLLLSLPTGAVNFAVLEYVRQGLGDLVASTPYLSSQLQNGGGGGVSQQQQKQKLGPILDFASSALSTIVCSLVATPQTMVCDNIMAGNYPNLPSAVSGLARRGGIRAFYQGWMPGLAGKIPAYALTWTLFQRFKDIRQQWASHPATNFENSVMACLASSASVCIMIPMDCIKTRLVTQGAGDATVYKGILDCAIRIAKEEGIQTFYRGLPPRLVSVVPMMAIQFAVYEAMKRSMLQRKSLQLQQQQQQQDLYN